MKKATVLIVDDEKDLQELLSYNLSAEGYDIITAETGEKALKITRQKMPDLIILDLMLPGIDGLDVCKDLKADDKTEPIPIIMLTAKGEESDIVTGLELGADDYVTKPFSPKVLIARVRRLLRRKQTRTQRQETLKIHELTIDPQRHEVRINDEPVNLTLTEYKILQTMAKRPGFVFTRYQIVDLVHGTDYLVTDRAIDVQIASLRKKLGKYGNYIETVRGVGYRFSD